MEQKTAANQLNENKAMAAAEAGMEYAIAYLNTNSAAVQSTASGGQLNYSFATVTQADNSTYSAVITNPTVNDFSILQITSTGNSADATATRVVRQQVYRTSSSVNYGLTVQGNAALSGNSAVTGSKGVNAGGSVTLSGSASASSINQNDATLANIPTETLFISIFGADYNTIQSSSTYYGAASSVPWGSPMSGRIWVNGDVNLSSNVTMGTATNPVALIISGNFSSTGNVTLHGIIYVRGSVSVSSGNFGVNGGMVVEQNVTTLSGSANVNYNVNILNLLASAGTINGGNYSKIPGSWQDF